MSPELLEEAKRLSVEERLELVAAIWDTLAEDAGAVSLPVSDEHHRELDRRLQDRQQNPDSESSWDDVEERLRNR